MPIDADVPPFQLDMELAALLESLSLQQRIRVGPPHRSAVLGRLVSPSDLCVEADNDKRTSTHRTHRVRHPNERRRELPSKHHKTIIRLLVVQLPASSMPLSPSSPSNK
jgi:hypothetical protein